MHCCKQLGPVGSVSGGCEHACARVKHTCSPAAPQLLLKLAEAAKLREKIDDMFKGEHINSTEDRAVLHVATRARRDQVCIQVLDYVIGQTCAMLEQQSPLGRERCCVDGHPDHAANHG